MIVRPIVERHARDAAFLASLRDRAVRWPHIEPADVARLDERIEAHVDGLSLAGGEGFAICAEALASGGHGEVFAAAVLAIRGGERPWIEAVNEAVIAAPEAVRGLVSALGWIDIEAAEAHVDALLDAQDPVLVLAGIAGSAVHRRAPGTWLGQGLNAGDTRVRARALRAAGELGRSELWPMMAESLDDEDPECRFWAAWSGGLFGDGEAVSRLREEVIANGPHAEAALDVVAARLPLGEAHAMQRALAMPEDTRRLAAMATGAIGDGAAIPWLVEQLGNRDIPRAAGEAITRITGVDLVRTGLSKPPKPDEGDADPDRGLPWPDAEAVERWWAGRRGDFRPGVRRLQGEAIGVASLERTLATAGQRLRAAAAVEFAILEPARGVTNVKARVDRPAR